MNVFKKRIANLLTIAHGLLLFLWFRNAKTSTPASPLLWVTFTPDQVSFLYPVNPASFYPETPPYGWPVVFDIEAGNDKGESLCLVLSVEQLSPAHFPSQPLRRGEFPSQIAPALLQR